MEAVPMAAGGGVGIGYADSVDSSPRSRGGESWDEPFPSSAAAAASRLRLMCSYGGRIVPRPTDRSLCYLGGETRIVVVDRHSSLADLSAKLSRSLLGGGSFSLKYQLPNEDLDSLISVTTDEDLDNMIEEYDRIIQSSAGAVGPGGGGGNTGSTRSNRLRLFLFPSKPDSAPSSIGSLLDDSKSETWFVDALNSAMGIGIDGLSPGLSTDSTSVNCLLGLEDDSSTHSRGVGGGGPGAAAASSEPEQLILSRPDSSGKLARQGQDVHSVPDSPMLDTTSSFGSTSSAPSLSNLPPIRVRPEDRPPDQRTGGLEDHLAHINLSSAAVVVSGHRPDEGYKDSNFPPYQPHPLPIPLPTASASTPTISPTENSSRVFSDDEKSDHGGIRKQPPPPQPKPTPIDAPISDSTTRPMYYPERASSAATAINPVSERRREQPVSADPSYRVSMPVSDSGYVLPHVPPEQFQQQQFIPANTHYIHHPATGTVVPVPSYYPIAHPIQQPQQAHPYDPQIPMYYLPVRQNPQPYNLAAVPPNLADPTPAKPTVSFSRAPAKPELPANLFRTAAASAPPPAALQPAQAAPPLIHLSADQVPHQYAGVGYHVMHHHPSQAPPAMANYGYEYADPAHAHLYYSQAGSAPQYQKVSATAVIPDALPGDVKHARAS